MQPPSLQLLTERIRQVQANGIINKGIADRLIENNQADDPHRKGMIWFCFGQPPLDDESGIACFFHYWGGEALYNFHENDPITGGALRRIGRPCLIEADVPISSFGPYTYLGDHILNRYLATAGLEDGDGWDHEDKSRDQISAANIVRIIFHGEPDFATLTGCDMWSTPLDAMNGK
jgi:hypothetical protein